MKTYEEMIQYTVDKVDSGILRYQEWTAVILLSEAYGVSQEIISSDIKVEKEFREKARLEKRRMESRASNEKRRLANLESQG
jgi:hypothetical protein